MWVDIQDWTRVKVLASHTDAHQRAQTLKQPSANTTGQLMSTNFSSAFPDLAQ